MKNAIYNQLTDVRSALQNIKKENLSLSQRLTIERAITQIRVLQAWIWALPF